MIDSEWAQWLLFMLFAAVLPLKAIIQYLLSGIVSKPNILLRLDEEGFHERHYAQLYRPGDCKYNKIVELADKAKAIN